MSPPSTLQEKSAPHSTAEIPVNQILQGHVLDVLATLPDTSVDMVMTSPPYWGLRDYRTPPQIWDGDPDCSHRWLIDRTVAGRRQQAAWCIDCSAWRGSLGLEPTLDLYIRHLGDVFEAVRRVLKPTGTCWVNLGDTFAGQHNRARLESGPIPTKSLCLIPARFSIEMVRRGWIARNRLIWHKPNGGTVKLMGHSGEWPDARQLELQPPPLPSANHQLRRVALPPIHPQFQRR